MAGGPSNDFVTCLGDSVLQLHPDDGFVFDNEHAQGVAGHLLPRINNRTERADGNAKRAQSRVKQRLGIWFRPIGGLSGTIPKPEPSAPCSAEPPLTTYSRASAG